MPVPLQSSRALGRALKDARCAKGLTQAQVAEFAGTVQPTISNIERGVSQVTLATLLRITAALGLELVLRDRESIDPRAPWEDGP
jgi:HTH-type transcriptional regulator / antitoxin HipB